MGPLIPRHKSRGSSESDEDDYERHDRFRSERFKDDNEQHNAYNRERKEVNCNERDNKRQRARSPLRHHRDNLKDINISSSSSSNTHKSNKRSNHDRKKEKHHHAKSSNIKKSVETLEKTDETTITDNKSKKKSLSNILKNFDKDLANRKDFECPTAIGPALPPHLIANCKTDPETVANTTEFSVVGPVLPQHLIKPAESVNIDVSLNERCQKTTVQPNRIHKPASPTNIDLESKIVKSDSPSHDIKSDSFIDNKQVVEGESLTPPLSSDVKTEVFGPILPIAVENESYGPVLPPNLLKVNIHGPRLPDGMTVDQLDNLAKEDSEDEDTVGPLPDGKMNSVQFQLDLRASEIKRKIEEEKSGTSVDIKKREEWMLELPPGKAANIGLGPRSFRKREAPDLSDRSSWTDTPADKLRKMEQALSGEPAPIDTEELKRTAFIKERDQAMDKMAQPSHGQDKPQSLLELHQKKLKKKKNKEEKEGKKKERRPFDRNIDLQVNRFDDAQKKAIFKKAQLLDTRFSSGESKYL